MNSMMPLQTAKLNSSELTPRFSALELVRRYTSGFILESDPSRVLMLVVSMLLL